MIRTEDVFARYGGEEFVVLVRGIEHANVGRFAERVRDGGRAARDPVGAGTLRVTISVGVASLDELAGAERHGRRPARTSPTSASTAPRTAGETASRLTRAVEPAGPRRCDAGAIALDAPRTRVLPNGTESRFTPRSPQGGVPMAVDIKKLFNEDLPAALAKNAEDAKTIGAKYQMNITGEGEWNIDVSATGPVVQAGHGRRRLHDHHRRRGLPEARREPAGQRDAALLRGQAQGHGQPDARDEAEEALRRTSELDA